MACAGAQCHEHIVAVQNLSVSIILSLNYWRISAKSVGDFSPQLMTEHLNPLITLKSFQIQI
jgi:hypothetical protein